MTSKGSTQFQSLASTNARIAYLQDDNRFLSEKPYLYLLPQHPDFPITNCTFSSSVLTPVVDVRGYPQSANFDNDGFEFLTNPVPDIDLALLASESKLSPILLLYLDRMRLLAQQRTRADDAIVFDWRIRRFSPTDSVDGIEEDTANRHEFTRPAYKAHGDLSPRGGWLTLKAYLKEEEYLKVSGGKWRARMVTCWRPLVPQILDCPLAFCKRGSIENDDFVPYDRVDGTGDGEGLFLKQSKSQSWYWLSRQTRDEVSFFESWDSASQGCNAHTIHAAFQLSSSQLRPEERRTSIEVRIIALQKNHDEA
ncbi:hypothetical protein O1611_g3518 [Lasiodiplodia mahajangana]|uniref:Uncharacterized protein n=1 Tax=Lasiodiplodia mahajangana TaxID=1108764 RepID=A0ACC2JRY0_9PEZI|nr:hypothetical protein O1611_g3518 [Lasiodiplodia mahajangana]